MAVLISRFLEKLRTVYGPGELCPFKITAASLFLVQKMHLDDECWFLREFGVITGLPPFQLGEYELAMCRLLDFRLHVDAKDLRDVNQQLDDNSSRREQITSKLPLGKDRPDHSRPIASLDDSSVFYSLSSVWYSVQLTVEMVIKIGSME